VVGDGWLHLREHGLVLNGLSIVPANEASWDDLQTVVGPMRCHGGRCFCQRFKVGWSGWGPGGLTDEERAHRFREQTDCSHPGDGPTSGLVAFLGGEPVGWCNVEPRPEFAYLPDARVVSKRRGEDRSDPTVWAVTCFVVRAGHRRQGIMNALAVAAVEFARERGARAIEAYPMLTRPDVEITWGELHVGSRNAFERAGMSEVAHPTKRRYVMRIDL
jgi:GNAT superfamily N-acetyltransferase